MNRSAAAEQVDAIASRLVAARRNGGVLDAFPGPLPEGVAGAYACQDAAIGLWPDRIAGWKVGWVGEEWRRGFAQERLVGPVFSGNLRIAQASHAVEAGIYGRGFAAVEAEFVLRIARDAPPGQTIWHAREVEAMVGAMHMGIEIASSPLAAINALGPAAIAADFGNNAGLIVGAPIPDWQKRDPQELRSMTRLNGTTVGEGSAASVTGGPLAALAFALESCARRGLPLRAGQYVCTGATTGIHVVAPGDEAEVVFEGVGSIRCRLREMTPC